MLSRVFGHFGKDIFTFLGLGGRPLLHADRERFGVIVLVALVDQVAGVGRRAHRAQAALRRPYLYFQNDRGILDGVAIAAERPNAGYRSRPAADPGGWLAWQGV